MKYRPLVIILLLALLACGSLFAQKAGRRTPPPPNKAAESLIDAGDKLADDRKWNEAADAYKSAIRVDPENADAYIGLGNAYMGAGKWTEALVAYKKAVSLAPQSADAQYALGDAYNTMRMHGDAFAPLVKAIQLDPTFAEAFYGIGYAYLSGEQYAKSLSFLKSAIALKPDYDDAHYGLALAYLNLGNQKGLDDERKKLVGLNSALVKKLDGEINKFNPGAREIVSSEAAPTSAGVPSAPEPPKQKPTPSPDSPVRRTGTQPTAAAALELALWDSIKNSKDLEDFNYYLRKYPNGKFAELARIKAEKSQPPSPTSATPGPPSKSEPAPIPRTTSIQNASPQPQRDQIQLDGVSQRRVALVIGNGAYTSAPPLKNPPNDARDMVATLRELGFVVTSGINVNQREMKRAIREFGLSLKAGGSGLFYYAGHGVQSKGHNYLIPIDAEIQSEAEVEDFAVDVNLILNFMDDAQNGLNIVILDACRDNPFGRSFRSASNGLAQVEAPTGTLIAYATAPGRVASDGSGRNGLYTSELLKQMPVSGLSVTEMFMRVRAEVMRGTGNRQVPWEASSLIGAFYFAGRPATESNSSANNSSGNASKVDASVFELSYWESIKNSRDPEEFKSYLEKYPNGHFVVLAKNKLRQLDMRSNETNRVSDSNAGSDPGKSPEPSSTSNNAIEGDKTIASVKAFDVRNGVRRTSGVLELSSAGLRYREVGGKNDFIVPCRGLQVVTINTSWSSTVFHKLHIKYSFNGVEKQVDLDGENNKQMRDMILEVCAMKKN